MKITIDLDYEGAMELERHLERITVERGDDYTEGVTEALDAVEAALEAENERRCEAQQERLRESGGVDDSAYRRDMRDAGRGHLLR